MFSALRSSPSPLKTKKRGSFSIKFKKGSILGVGCSSTSYSSALMKPVFSKGLRLKSTTISATGPKLINSDKAQDCSETTTSDDVACAALPCQDVVSRTAEIDTVVMQRAVIFFPRLAIPNPSFFTRSSIKMSTKKPPPSPVCPKFVSFDGGDGRSRSKPDGFRFSLVSYNILAQVYVKSASFPHSPASCLKWKARSQAILTVLKGLGVDFLCLQEVDEYNEFYKSNMASNGYSSIYVKRSGQKRDGCGIFYKQDRANLVLEEKIDYNDLVNSIQDDSDLSVDKDNHKTMRKNEDTRTQPGSTVTEASKDSKDSDDPHVRLKRDCVGIMAAFRLNNKSQDLIIVANTHLYWDPDWADVKLAQAKYLLSRLAEFRTMVSEKFECTPLVIVAGDFNSTPGDKVYSYLVSGDISVTSAECLEELLPLPLRSVYACTRGEPTFTNCTPGFTGTLDYIFLSPSFYIKPVGLLELPEADSEDVIGSLPNYYQPSDHLPIGAEFEVLGNSQV